MNKQDKIIVGLLFAALIAWSFLNKPKSPVPGMDTTMPEAAAQTNQISNAAELQSGADQVVTTKPPLEKDVQHSALITPPSSSEHSKEERTASVSNDALKITVSSWGGGIKSAQLNKYRATCQEGAGPVELDFSASPALTLAGIPGLTADRDFEVESDTAAGVLNVKRLAGNGLAFTRKIELVDGYRVMVRDEFLNTSESPVELAQHSVALGPMGRVDSKATVRKGMAYLGINSLGSGGTDEVVYWEAERKPGGQKKLSKRFYEGTGGGGCTMFGSRMSRPMPHSIPPVVWEQSTDWVAVKNRFFVQSLAPEKDADGIILNAKRLVPENEDPAISKSWMKTAVLDEVSAQLVFNGVVVQPGETLTREMRYFIGPKKHELLKQLGNYQDRIMFRTWSGWGWYRYVCVGLLKTLNWIHSLVPNYGLAIIILTIIIKIIFWPIMQKNTDSMKKMQELKPELDKLKEKYKSNPQKMQQEQMALYKKHKINPLAGCLPMMIQMPVFIAMFTVIRKAVELRCAGFLWISDLSEPERLFDGMIPFVGSLNILPLLMVATMLVQQKMTPSTGDAQQKQMMMMMPVMMLLFLYNMASGLTLYWTVSQLLSIVQLYMQRKKA